MIATSSAGVSLILAPDFAAAFGGSLVGQC
jgi:hypothetical protein